MVSLSKSSILDLSIRNTFVTQIKIIYNSKQQLIGYFPVLLNDCNYPPLKQAIIETLNGVEKNASMLRNIIKLLNEDTEYKYCLGAGSLVYETYNVIKSKKQNAWEVDMMIIYYLTAMISQQWGVIKSTYLITKVPPFCPFAPPIQEIADTRPGGL